MIISPAHAAARAAAARHPANVASLALLATGPEIPTIEIYSAPDPETGILLVTIPLAPGVGSIDEATHRINLTVPLEAQIVADGEAVCARVVDAGGAIWGDVTVSDPAGAGEIKLLTTALVAGAFARITSAYIQG